MAKRRREWQGVGSLVPLINVYLLGLVESVHGLLCTPQKPNIEIFYVAMSASFRDRTRAQNARCEMAFDQCLLSHQFFNNTATPTLANASAFPRRSKYIDEDYHF